MEDELEVMLGRVRGWPAERKEQALGLLIALERFGEVLYPLSPEEIADLEEAEAAEARGEFASEEEVARVFRLKR